MALTLHRGDSGSAVFDAQGRLIGMAFAYSVSPERDWAVPLNEIVSAYEDITGNTLYTY
jgi:S1-C subfamily serine protease